MHIQVIITRTDGGATTQIRMDEKEVRKDYDSWNDALEEAQNLELINVVEATTAKILPPGMPLHTSTDIQSLDFTSRGFTSEKLPPPQ
jgi:hypothetical protein